MSMWWCLRLRREPSSVPLARRLLLGAMDTAGVEKETSYELSLALTEACANAVEHGTGDRSDAYRVTVHLDGDRCRVEVADSGPGFGRTHAPATAAPADPAVGSAPADSAPARPGSVRATGDRSARTARRPLDAENGRGLLLIEALADHVRVRDRYGCGGVITFDKALKWRRAEDGALLEVG